MKVLVLNWNFQSFAHCCYIYDSWFDKFFLQRRKYIILMLSCFHFLILSYHMYHGDAWRVLLDTAGTMTPDYDPEAMASLNKFVDQLPSVFNQVFYFIFDKINQVFLHFIHTHGHGVLERTNPWFLIQVWLFLCDCLHSAYLVIDLLQHSLVQLHDVKYLWLLKWTCPFRW